MPYLHLAWPIAEGVITEPIPVVITSVNVDVIQELFVVYLSPCDAHGLPIPGQRVGVTMPEDVLATFATSQTVPVLQALLRLPVGGFSGKQFDFSKATLIEGPVPTTGAPA